MPVAVVLAGGVGSRLYPLTRVIPKPLIPFAGAPLLEYIVEKTLAEGFTEVIIAARYLGEQIVDYFKGKPSVRALLLDSKDTADAVRLVSSYLKGDFLVSMGDVVTDIPFGVFYKSHLERGSTASIVLKQVENPLPYGLVYIDSENYVVLFAEKPRSIEAYLLSLAHYRVRGVSMYSNLVNAGIYAFGREVVDVLLKNPGLMDFGKHVFPYLLEEGYRIYGWVAPESSYWNDIGRIPVYKEALWDFLDGKVRGWSPRGRLVVKGVYIAREAVVEGMVYPPAFIGENTRVEPGASVGPYVVLERGVTVERNSKLSYTVAWHYSKIGEGAYVYDSVVMNNASLKPGVKVVSSVVGSGCTVGVDLYNKVLEPCIEVSPYAVTW